MAFVDVPDGGLQVHRGERAHAADAEHQLLLQARAAIAAVQAVRDGAVALVVFRHVGIQQEQAHMADARLPHLDHELSSREREFDREIAPRLLHRLDRQVGELRVVVLGALAAFGVDRLHEVALPVEQAHADEGQLEVARRLAVVPGEDAEAAGVERQALVHAELGAEVGDELVRLEASRVLPERRVRLVGIERGEHALQAVEERGIGGGVDQTLLVDALEHRLGVVADRVPQRRIQAREDGARRAVPAVPEIPRELVQPREALGQLRIDFELVASPGWH